MVVVGVMRVRRQTGVARVCGRTVARGCGRQWWCMVWVVGLLVQVVGAHKVNRSRGGRQILAAL